MMSSMVERMCGRDLDDLNARAPAGFLIGDAYSLADLVWTVTVARLKMIGLEPLVGRPALAAWYARVQARPSFEEADVWERVKPARLLGMFARKLLRLG